MSKQQQKVNNLNGLFIWGGMLISGSVMGCKEMEMGGGKQTALRSSFQGAGFGSASPRSNSQLPLTRGTKLYGRLQ